MVRGRGTKSPFFMEESKIIENTVKGTINSNCDLFLIDFKIENEKINVTIDGDRGVSIKDCAGISREIEFILSKNNLNFAINVSSFGTSSPLVNLRQFKKNIITSWIVFIISFLTYFSTVEPTASYWDCSEYIATSAKLQVGHPPGAPLFLSLIHI